MTAHDLVQYVSWSVYILIFILVTIQAVRRPLSANIDIAIFFLALTINIALSVAGRLGLTPSGPEGDWIRSLSTSIVLALAYLLIRLVDDFAGVPSWISILSGVSLVLLVGATFAYPAPRPGWLILLQILHLNGFLIYAAVVLARHSAHSAGVTRRRMRAVAAGSIFLVLTVFLAGLRVAFPNQIDLLQALGDVAGLATGISYFLGFAPPTLVRRAWQEPELRAFLGRAASLPRLPDTLSILREMERGAAKSLGAANARVGLWDEDKDVIRYNVDGEITEVTPDMSLTAGRAFLTQRPTFNPNIQMNNPMYGDAARKHNAKALLAAPITAGDKKLGVLLAYAPKEPIFAQEDMDLIQLLADQAAVILESRALIDEAARVQAHEEAARMKDDFLSAAAHDLKTPLTILVAQTQLLERRAARDPNAPVDLASLRKLGKEVQRLRLLVTELLDAATAEQGRLVGTREPTDLVSLAEESCQRHTSERHRCLVEASETVIGEYDRTRVLQLIENLVENAVKYSPDGGEVCVKLWHDNGWNHFTVTDQGIGIPRDEIGRVFDRFHRGRNVDDRRFAGMGLGLFICRGIAEQHGGHISVSSVPGVGSTFHVELPVEETAARA